MCVLTLHKDMGKDAEQSPGKKVLPGREQGTDDCQQQDAKQDPDRHTDRLLIPQDRQNSAGDQAAQTDRQKHTQCVIPEKHADGQQEQEQPEDHANGSFVLHDSVCKLCVCVIHCGNICTGRN